MLKEQFYIKLFLIAILGVLFIFTMARYGKRNSIEETPQKHIVLRIIGCIFFILALTSAIMGLWQLGNVAFPLENIEPPIHRNMIVRSSYTNLIWGYPTKIQTYIIAEITNFFAFSAIGTYFMCFKKSKSQWWKKILKFIYFTILFFLFHSATEFHYFDLPEIIPSALCVIMLLCGWRKGTAMINKEAEEQPINITDNEILINNEIYPSQETIETKGEIEKEQTSSKKMNTLFSAIKSVLRNTIIYIKRLVKSNSTHNENENTKCSRNNYFTEKYNNLSSIQKWWILVYALYFFVILFCYVAGEFPPNDELEFLILFYFIIPLVIYIIHFSFKNYRRKTIIFFSTISILAVIATISLVGYDIYEDKQEEKERERIENTPKINRTFLNCELGDTINVLDAINWTVEQRIEHIGYMEINEDATEVTYALNNIKYGNYDLSRIKFFYYNNKLTKVTMRIDITYDDYTHHWTFNEITDMFTQKGYNDVYHRYSNEKQYHDKFTRVEVGYYAKDGNYFVQITYYDKTSGYEEMLESGF